jgi:hypothetical protein
MVELWRDVVGYEGLYQISNYGRLKSLSRVEHLVYSDGRQGVRNRKEKILNPSTDKDGYLITGLRRDGVQKTVKLHRIVAIAFIPNFDSLPEVNHKDGNKHNNTVDNLEWSSHQDNITHAVETELRDGRGERNVNAKLTGEDVAYIRKNYTPRHKEFSAVALSNKFGVSATMIHNIMKGRNWNE